MYDVRRVVRFKLREETAPTPALPQAGPTPTPSRLPKLAWRMTPTLFFGAFDSNFSNFVLTHEHQLQDKQLQPNVAKSVLGTLPNETM